MRSHHLLALRAPGNVERDLHEIQLNILAETGASSAQALPPMIPLEYPANLPEVSVCDLVAWRDLPPLELARPVAEPAGLRLSVAIPLPLTEWAGRVAGSRSRRGHPQIGPALYLGAGFYLSGPDGSSLPAEKLKTWCEPLRGVFLRSVSVELMHVRTAEPPEWWESVDWSVLWKRWIKLRG